MKNAIEIEVNGTKFESKTQAIKTLASQGYTKYQISKLLNISYQHVYNTLNRTK